MNKVILDLVGMEPPEPALKIVEAANSLKPGDMLEARGDRPFKNIFAELDRAGYRHHIEPVGSIFVLKVWNDGGAKKIGELGHMDCTDEAEEGRPEIGPEIRIDRLIEEYPEAVDILVEAGFAPLKDPVLRKTMMGDTTLGEAQYILGMDDGTFAGLVSRLKELEILK